MAKSEYMVTLNGYKIKDTEAVQGLSISGKTITITKRDGTTSTITTQDTNTQYSAGTGLSLSGTTFNHSNSVTAATNVGGSTADTPAYGATFNVPYFSYDAQGHITASGTKTVKIPASDKVTVTDNLTSTSTTAALSAAQGKALNDAKAPLASPALTGTPTAPTAAAGTNSTQIATTAFVKSAVDTAVGTLADAMIFKGTVAKAADLPAAHETGWTYKVATAGTYAGKVCEVGDMIICIANGTTANNADWTVVQNNIDGAVTGPTSGTVGNIATFSNANGKVIQDGGASISKTLTTTSDTQVPTSKAVATYVTGLGYKTTDNDTKNTAGSTASTEQLYIIGATSQAANPQTYSNASAYIGTDGCLYSGGAKVITDISGKADKASITAGTAGTSSATSGVSISIPYVTANAQGIVTGYGTHTHTISKTDITGLGIPASNTTYSAGTGLTLTNTTFSANAMTGATASAAGQSGRVPAPAAGAQAKFLRGDATWADIALSITDDGAGNIVFGLATE